MATSGSITNAFFQEILTDCGAIDCPVGSVCSCGQPLYQRCEIAGTVSLRVQRYSVQAILLEILTAGGAFGTVCLGGQPLPERCEIPGLLNNP